jgi:hypothetical protein
MSKNISENYILKYNEREALKSDFSEHVYTKAVSSFYNKFNRKIQQENVNSIEIVYHSIMFTDRILKLKFDDLRQRAITEFVNDLKCELNYIIYGGSSKNLDSKKIRYLTITILYTSYCTFCMSNGKRYDLSAKKLIMILLHYYEDEYNLLKNNPTLLRNDDFKNWFKEYSTKKEYLSDSMKNTIVRAGKNEVSVETHDRLGSDKDKATYCAEFKKILNVLKIKPVLTNSINNNLYMAFIAYKQYKKLDIGGSVCVAFLHDVCKFETDKKYNREYARDVINTMINYTNNSYLEKKDEERLDKINKYGIEINNLLS